MCVLLASPESHWPAALADALRAEWFDVVVEHDATRLLSASDARAHLVVIDLSLRDPSGLDVCASLRQASDWPLLAVGGGDEAEIVAALGAGADAFVVRSTSQRELVARLRAVLRRFPSTVGRSDAGVLVSGDLELDSAARTVLQAGRSLELGRVGTAILEELMRRAGRTVHRNVLSAIVRQLGSDEEDLDLHLRRLRERIEAGGGQRRITTVRKVGFRLDDMAVVPSAAVAQ